GLSSEGLAWSSAVGLALGASPSFGTSTALCAGAAMTFRSNQPAMQSANYSAYPSQIASLLPFIRSGERLFGAPRSPLSLPMIEAGSKADAWGAMGALWTSLWHAGVAWSSVVPVPVAVLALGSAPVFRKALKPFRRP
ncbi:hypothetical protein OY671_011336, partial [Metschnikowia pulcherrima]